MSTETTVITDTEGPINMTAGMRNALRRLGEAYDQDKAVRFEQVNTGVRNRLLRAGLIRGSNPTGKFVIVTDRGKQIIKNLAK